MSFKLPSNKPPQPTEQTERICLQCKKPLTSCKFRWRKNVKFCSHKCANRYNGKKSVGKPRTRLYGPIVGQIPEYDVE